MSSWSHSPRFDQLSSNTPGRESGDLTLLSVLRLVRKRRWLVIAVVIAGTLLGVILALQPRRYTATGSIRVQPGSSSMYNVTADKLLSGADSDDRIESEATILQSTSLLLQVAKQLDLANKPSFLGKALPAGSSLDDPYIRSTVLKAMRKNVVVVRVPKTQVLNISCTSGSPLLSAKVVNELSNSYVNQLFQNSFASTQRASRWLTGQLTDLKQTVENDQEQLVALQGKLGVVGFDSGHNLITSQLEALAKANAETSLERIVAEARFRILESSSPDLIEGGPMMLSANMASSTAGGSLLQTLRNSRAQMASKFADLNAQFDTNYPEVKQVKAQLAEVDKQINDEQKRVFNQAKLSYEAARRNEDMTKASFSNQKKVALENSDTLVKYEVLLHEYQVNRTLYEGLTERLREAGIVAGLASSEVDIVDVADVPFIPSGPSRFETVLISTCFGLMGGLLTAFIVDSVDTSVSGSDDLALLIDIPVLAVLPKIADGVRGRETQLGGSSEVLAKPRTPEVLTAPFSPFSEGVQTLRTALLLSRAARPPRVILITSASPGEGKSTVSSNLACQLAKNNARILIIDADLRIPTQHQKFGLGNDIGLSSVLTGAATLSQALQTSKLQPGLKILTSGPLTSSAGTLISSEQMRNLIADCAERFDHVLLDSPPCGTISDALVLAHMSEAAILVVRQRTSKKNVIRRVVQNLELTGVAVPGFVLNGVDKASMDYDGYYGHYHTYANAALVPSERPEIGASLNA